MQFLRPGWRCFGGFIAFALFYIVVSGLGMGLDNPSQEEVLNNKAWIATSKHWVDRQACRWLGFCGTLHLNSNIWTWSRGVDTLPPLDDDLTQFWNSSREDPDSWSGEERRLREVPQFVLDHAPYVHLFSGEEFWPCDLGEHLTHTTPRLNYTAILEMEQDRNLTNLDQLNTIEHGRHGRYVYLQSKDNPEERPGWLVGSKNIPATARPRRGPDPESDADVPWPSLDDLEGLDLESAKQQALEDHDLAHTEDAFSLWPGTRTPSENGRCAGNSGFTCKDSAYGQCCSIHGWCGASEDYCGNYCDPLAGDCFDPLNPPRGPRADLRRKKRDLTGARHKPSPAGRSSAPAFLVMVDKGDGILDAFWFFFYSFNLGQKVLNIRFGNHVGDWEHTLIRFRNGKPDSIFLSEHDFGDAYSWDAIEKYIPNPDGSETMIGTWSNRTAAKVAKRPVVYSAIGSHAMYATPGLHPYILPWGLLHDQTDRGPLWDPALNLKSFTYDVREKKVRASTRNPLAPTGWFDYAGHWGDKYYALSDPRQYRFAAQYHYVNGPTGPKFKNLGRKNICQGHGGECHIRNWLGGSRPKRIPIDEGEEEGGLPGGNSTDDTL